ncbi:MAG: hypothetical protein BZY82_06620 [SAR202 cluster bacterium Io17-Chloro-G3]|nr:MAG: hypothetical protein BZY82_06620 [SAR202 cluster bacterium Io17-Chloro-G3]
MFDSAVIYFQRHIESVNALNVFPVPDKDTGTNMYQTLRNMKIGIEREQTGRERKIYEENRDETSNRLQRSLSDLEDLSLRLWVASFFAAKGNSGSILAHVFKGIFEGLTRSELVDVSILVKAKEEAYSTFPNPVEGTMLTVLRDLATESVNQSVPGVSICNSFNSMIEIARISVDSTPSLLSILKESGVVDSGGYGVEIILRGMALFLSREDPETTSLYLRFPDDEGEGIERLILQHQGTNEEYGYCTQFVLESSVSEELLDKKLDEIGESLAILGSHGVFRVHIHAKDPGKPISVAVDLGVVSEVSVENMENQSKTMLMDQNEPKSKTQFDSVDIGDKTALVALASGEGIKEFLLDSGANLVIEAGDTANPSVGEILDCLEAISANSVLLLPNNKNIASTAHEAAKMADSNVVVLPTVSVLQGMECSFAFDPDLSAQINSEMLVDVMGSVKTILIFPAARSVEINGVSALEGQPVAMLDSKLILSATTNLELLVRAIEATGGQDSDQITVFLGNRLDELDLDPIRDFLESSFGDLEHAGIELHWGGQPHYDFMVSVVSS